MEIVLIQYPNDPNNYSVDQETSYLAEHLSPDWEYQVPSDHLTIFNSLAEAHNWVVTIIKSKENRTWH